MEKELYNFRNFYIITTYKCNLSCNFCLFKNLKIKDCQEEKILNIVERVLYYTNEKIYFKITGGEPLLKISLLEKMFSLFEKYKHKIYKIGIGTNGTIQIPDIFNSITIKTDIFFSRHSTSSLYLLDYIVEKIDNKNISIKTNCNLIDGQIDSIEKISKYLNIVESMPFIKGVCFRELNRVNVNENKIYDKYIYDYINYYKNNLVRIDEIIKNLSTDFIQSRITGNDYDNNYWYWYKNKLSVKFRKIEEDRLIKYNKLNKGLDEYVLHPDGLLTGCWDRDIKKINIRRIGMPSRPFICKEKNKIIGFFIKIIKKIIKW